ncbi:MAG: hypothetical protein RBS17_01730 [Coriobacteriia bacterium]|nr:hypothetical protein [Coriobacteriia bacterium]
MRRAALCTTVAYLLCAMWILNGCAAETTAPSQTQPVVVSQKNLQTRIEPPSPGGLLIRNLPLAESAEANQAPPDVYDLPHARTQVIGTLDYRDIFGGTYCIMDCYPWEPIDEADILSTVTAEDTQILYSLYESYVSADGNLVDADGVRRLSADSIVGVNSSESSPWAQNVSWATARREKPHTMVVDDTLRIVGTLVFVERYRDVATDSWAVVDALDPSSTSGGLTTQHVMAFLNGEQSTFPAEGSYVDVYGTETGARVIAGSRLPTIQIAQIAELP